MAKQTVLTGTTANDGKGDQLRNAFIKLNQNFDEVYGTNFVTQAMLNDDIVDHAELANRFTAEVSISTLTGTVNYDFSAGSTFKLSGDLTNAYTINLTNYKKGQVITIYPLKAQTVTLTGGSGTGVFNKLSEVDYDNTTSSILQIECVDDQAANPVFFYSVATFAPDATI